MTRPATGRNAAAQLRPGGQLKASARLRVDDVRSILGQHTAGARGVTLELLVAELIQEDVASPCDPRDEGVVACGLLRENVKERREILGEDRVDRPRDRDRATGRVNPRSFEDAGENPGCVPLRQSALSVLGRPGKKGGRRASFVMKVT